jgi:hypothetical protein
VEESRRHSAAAAAVEAAHARERTEAEGKRVARVAEREASRAAARRRYDEQALRADEEVVEAEKGVARSKAACGAVERDWVAVVALRQAASAQRNR